MKKLNSLLLLVFILLGSITTCDVFAHPGYNSEEQVIGKYRVSTSTIPEIPTTGEPSTIIITIYDLDFNPITDFDAGVRIFYNDEQIDAIPMTSIQGNHWDLNYIFEEPGNHVFRVTVDDAGSYGKAITYTFNISTLNPFGYIFIYVIASGGIAGVGIMFYSYISRRKTPNV